MEALKVEKSGRYERRAHTSYSFVILPSHVLQRELFLMTRFFAARRLPSVCVALVVCLGALPLFALDAGPAGQTRVIRTMTHHQITSDARGVWGILPVVSDNG